MGELETLLARCEAATEADRAIDIAFDKAMGVIATNDKRLDEYMRQGWFETFTPNYTDSIDAALALVERLLPGWDRETTRHIGGGLPEYTVRLAPSNSATLWRHVGEGPTEPIAILVALLRTLIARRTETGV